MRIVKTNSKTAVTPIKLFRTPLFHISSARGVGEGG